MAAPKQTWYLCDLVSGLWRTRLPIAGDQVTCNIWEVNRATVTMDIADDACPDEWAGYLKPAYNRMLVLTKGSGLDEKPVQGWWLDGELVQDDWSLSIPIATLEACYDEANIPEVYGTYDDAYAAFLLCTLDVGADGLPTGLGGMAQRFGFIHEYAFTGNTSDHDYSPTATTTRFAAVRQMMDDKRIEARIQLRWNSDRTGFVKVTQIKSKVGTYRKDSKFSFAPQPDDQVAGTIASYRKRTGRGTTAVTGTAVIEGSQNIVNPPVVATEMVTGPDRFPVVESRRDYTGLDSVDNIEAAILERSTATLNAEKGGVVVYDFVLNTDTLVPGDDYDAGDTVPIDIGPRPKVDPFGLKTDARLCGFTLNLRDGTAVPNLWPTSDGNTS